MAVSTDSPAQAQQFWTTDRRRAVEIATFSNPPHKYLDKPVRALVVRAEGNDFSAGADVSVFMGLGEAEARELDTTVLSLTGAIEHLPIPTLALIHGQCYAGALEVCLACDLIWAAEGSQIGQIEVMLSQDLKDGIASLQRSGPGHAIFNNR